MINRISFQKKSHKQIFWIFITLIILIIFWFLVKPKNLTSNILKVEVQKGNFEIGITTTGELEAKDSENLLAPNTREVGIHSLKIEHIVPNGTLVKEGDYIATLNKSELLSKIREKNENIAKFEAQYITTKLDTTSSLKSARNDLLNQKIELEGINIELEQSIYEPPTTIRQLEMKLDKAIRAHNQKITSYKLQVEKEKAKINEVASNLKNAKRELKKMQALLKDFTIRAPKAGMVVHPRGYGSERSIIGRELRMHNPVVATLPNLTELISKTYINEIDIAKVKKGQSVKIGIDAFPDKSYIGKVIHVANMGNQYMAGSAKLFEVEVELKNTDNILKPSMTTKNEIRINTYEDVLFIPIECIHHAKGYSFVYTESLKKQVIVGEANDDEIIILEGLIPDEKVCLSTPENPDSFRFVKLDDSVLAKYNKAN